jgi:hypothetical protein
MKALNGQPPFRAPFDELRHVRDLVYFDGPLLSQFVHPNGDNYLYYWCDCDDTANRWMVLRVAESDILRIENLSVPVSTVIPGRSKDGFVYFVDLDSEGTVIGSVLCGPAAIPDDYLPALESYIRTSVATNKLHSFSLLIGGRWTVKNFGDLPHIFSKLYSLLYTVNVLKPEELWTLPWRGNFSSMHFFNWVYKQVPRSDRPLVEALQYSSPGFVRFSLNARTAREVVECVNDFKANFTELTLEYDRLTDYIRKHKIKDIKNSESTEWNSHDTFLTESTVALLHPFSPIQEREFLLIAPRPFEAAQIARTIYRDVKKLIDFENEGLVEFPNQPLAGK